MRLFQFRDGRFPGSKPYVAMVYVNSWEGCEAVDRGQAFTREEALANPRYRDAPLAWEAGDDTEATAEEQRWRALMDADQIIDRAEFEIEAAEKRAQGLVCVVLVDTQGEGDDEAIVLRGHEWVQEVEAELLIEEGRAVRPEDLGLDLEGR